MNSKYHQNSHLKAFSCEEKSAFKHLNKIWKQTKSVRDAVIRAQVYVHHGSDNCQEYHPFATQRQNTPGVMHTGMVFNMVQAKEYVKPPGTVMKDPNDNEWIVTSSSLSDYFVSGDLYHAPSELDDLSVETTKTAQSVCSNATGMSHISTTNTITEALNDLVAVGGTEVQDAFDSPPCKLSKKEDQEKALKRLGNVKRCKLNKQCTYNQFVEGQKKLLNVAAERNKERDKEKRKMQLIWDAVAFFKGKMKLNGLALNEILEKYAEMRDVKMKDWEIEYDESLTLFDEEQYLAG